MLNNTEFLFYTKLTIRKTFYYLNCVLLSFSPHHIINRKLKEEISEKKKERKKFPRNSIIAFISFTRLMEQKNNEFKYFLKINQMVQPKVCHT